MPQDVAVVSAKNTHDNNRSATAHARKSEHDDSESTSTENIKNRKIMSLLFENLFCGSSGLDSVCDGSSISKKDAEKKAVAHQMIIQSKPQQLHIFEKMHEQQKQNEEQIKAAKQLSLPELTFATLTGLQCISLGSLMEEMTVYKCVEASINTLVNDMDSTDGVQRLIRVGHFAPNALEERYKKTIDRKENGRERSTSLQNDKEPTKMKKVVSYDFQEWSEMEVRQFDNNSNVSTAPNASVSPTPQPPSFSWKRILTKKNDISSGAFDFDGNNVTASMTNKSKTKTNPVDLLPANYRQSMIHVLSHDFGDAISILEYIKHVHYQKVQQQLHCDHNELRNTNFRPFDLEEKRESFLLTGTTLHTIGVLHLLSGELTKAYECFLSALNMKQQALSSFRSIDDDVAYHEEIAVSLVEAGIILYAEEKFEDSLKLFLKALEIYTKICDYSEVQNDSRRHKHGNGIAIVNNNIACVHFQMGNSIAAFATFEEATRQTKKHMLATKGNMDLLHVATTLCNVGYAKLQCKDYENAITVLEEALLVQQSVLGDDHIVVMKTRGNLEFANAFHA
mmetsp:Transcript_41858/g.50195  ORF Transcript_41858/g.50195 Transcript_41858/m.50195 type:complete len:565 (+) Transcript_41858:26-1720(+)|eukprot:CAMPEP_0194373294 /NCGR_PEP_ID=MMETSP0174-20130528/21718_1 /TAXON_ID=216777 /ORGANISM="Proboscia alata, Strain PI-D3" /LENGTH=564 /DNA_ID=CAMNT_0039152275 /DNA_START=8 /DNA_END=1702 /DNA_ORIENTATION=+